MKKRRFRCGIVLLVCAVFLCAGCSFDVEQYLRPPATGGEQQAVQQALETYIRDSGQSDSRYTLCYPVEGEHTAAFVLCDAAGRPLQDTQQKAALALAFYAIDSAPNDIHINLLRFGEQDWVSIADVVGASSTILQVAFGDLDSDGTAELLTGWDTYNTREHQLVVFSLGQELARLSDDRLYNRLYVGDLTADGKDSLLLLRTASSGEASASHEVLVNGTLTTRGQVYLDSEIQQFTGMTLCRLADDVHGLFVEAIKGTNTAVTELLYVSSAGLQAPFCHQASRVNTVTARPAGFTMRDMDGDAVVEIPQCTLLDGYMVSDNIPEYAYRTDWMNWDYATKTWRVCMRTVMNTADGYYVALNESYGETLTTTYVQSERILTLQNTADNRPLLRLRPITQEDDSGYVTLFKAADGYAGCEVWFDEARLDMDAVRYMVARMEA